MRHLNAMLKFRRLVLSKTTLELCHKDNLFDEDQVGARQEMLRSVFDRFLMLSSARKVSTNVFMVFWSVSTGMWVSLSNSPATTRRFLS